MATNSPILAAVIALVLWSVVMWLWMYATRIPAMNAAKIDYNREKYTTDELKKLPLRVQWKADNYNHLFEQPTIFYAVALTLAPANTFLRRGADRLFDDGHDELSYLLQKGGDLTRFITTVDTLSHDFSRLLLETLKLSHVHFFLRSGSFFCFIRV